MSFEEVFSSHGPCEWRETAISAHIDSLDVYACYTKDFKK
jgi:hypothetical protein